MNEILPLSIVPSLPAQSFAELASLCEALKGIASGFQVDIVDGEFAPAVSWPFTEPDPMEALASLAPLSAQFELAVDCMVCDPQQYFAVFASSGVDSVVLHIGSTTDMAGTIAAARTHSFTVGLAFTNDVDLAEVHSYIPAVDYVQVMGIKVVGRQGQPFDDRTLDTVTELRQAFPNLTISVDGSVNETTIEALKQAGANRFAPGSAIAKAADPVEAFATLAALIGLQQPVIKRF